MKSKSYQKLTNRSRLIAGLGSIGLVAFVTIGIATLRAQQTYGPQHTYSVTDLGVVSGMTASEPAAINNLGQVAGTSTAGAHGCAFRYYYNNMQDVGGIGSR
jgi:probable HAF family extracellular repeat protein